MSVYGPSPAKRARRTRTELAALDAAIVAAVEQEKPVTLRGTYYRVVSAGAIEKTEAAYKTVGRRLVELRRSSTIPYSWITDGTRWINKPNTWTDLDAMLEDAAASYRRDFWHSQPVDVHVFSEKDALKGVISPVTQEYDVPLGVLRGYASESFVYTVADGIYHGRKDVAVYHFGDLDPSGLDAWRDFRSKVVGFLGGEVYAEDDYTSRMAFADADGQERSATFERLAVTAEQVARYRLLTRPTKSSDSRTMRFTGESVEVDAIAPNVLRGLLSDAIEQHVDAEALRVMRLAEKNEREVLMSMRGVS